MTKALDWFAAAYREYNHGEAMPWVCYPCAIGSPAVLGEAMAKLAKQSPAGVRILTIANVHSLAPLRAASNPL